MVVGTSTLLCTRSHPKQMISMDYRSPELEQVTRARIATLTAAWAAAHHAPDENGEMEMKDERGVTNGEEGVNGGLVVGAGRDAGGIKASWINQFAKVGGYVCLCARAHACGIGVSRRKSEQAQPVDSIIYVRT